MNFKKLIEHRNQLVEEMDKIVKNAMDVEIRALNDEETEQLNTLKAEIEQIDASLKLTETRQSTLETEQEPTQEVDETRAFAEYIRTGKILENRAAANFTKGDNGAIVPASIANKIIETVKNIAPIYALSSQYAVKGDLIFPVYDEATSKIECAYQDEFQAITGTAAKFKQVKLGGYVAGALSKVSRSLINNAAFDVVSYVVTKVATAIAEFLEHELILGDGTKMTGILTAPQVVTAGAATAITADDLISLKLKVPQAFRSNGAFILHPSTFAAIAKLKDNEGNYILNRDLKNAFEYTLLGCPVYESDNMPEVATGKNVVAFGDFSGLYTKVVEDGMEIDVLREKYAEEHAVGVIGWVEIDSKIVEPQKMAVLKMA